MGAFDYKTPISSGIKPAGLINGASAFSTKTNSSTLPPINNAIGSAVKVVSSPAMTANTLETVLNLSGKGALSLFMCQAVDATARNHRIKITMDGVVIFDATQAGGLNLYQFAIGTCAVGLNAADAVYDVAMLETPLCFDASCVVEFSSSLTETGKTYIGYKYYPR